MLIHSYKLFWERKLKKIEDLKQYLKTWKILVIATFVFGSYVVRANLGEFILVSFGVTLMIPITLLVTGNTKQGRSSFMSMLISYMVLSVLLGIILEIITGKILSGGLLEEVATITTLISLTLAVIFTKRFFPPGNEGGKNTSNQTKPPLPKKRQNHLRAVN